MFFLKIERIESELTKSEKKLINYIKENLVLVKKYNVMDLAEKSGVSAPSIIRLAKKVGYTGFLDMKIDLNKSKNHLTKENIILENLFDSCKEKFLELPPTVTLDRVLSLTKYLKKSEKIILICEKDFSFLEKYIYSKLALKGKSIFLNLGDENNYELLKKFKENDIIFFLGLELSKNMRDIILQFKEKEINTIFIGENQGEEDETLLEASIYLNCSIVENFFIYALLIENILNLI